MGVTVRTPRRSIGPAAGMRSTCRPTPSSSPTSATSSTPPTSSTYGWTGLGATHVLPGHDGPDADLVPAVRPACEVRMLRSTHATQARTDGWFSRLAGSGCSLASWGVGKGHRPDAAPSATTFAPPTTHQPPGTAGVTPFRVTNDVTPSPGDLLAVLGAGWCCADRCRPASHVVDCAGRERRRIGKHGQTG